MDPNMTGLLTDTSTVNCHLYTTQWTLDTAVWVKVKQVYLSKMRFDIIIGSFFNWFVFKFCCESSKHNKLFMWSISTCDKGSREVNLSSAQTSYLRSRSYPPWSVNFSGLHCENALLASWEWLGGKREDWMRCVWMYVRKQGRLGNNWLASLWTYHAVLGPIEV